MSSQLRSETSRINGAKSRGPTTTAGLEKSSRNATKHGLTSGSAIILACEIQAEFDNILNDFIATYQPANPAEKDLVEEMVAARWRIRRLWTIETCMLDAEIVKQELMSTTHHPGIHLALAFRTLADESHSLHLTSRYESRLHRIYDHAYATLREIQQTRDSLPPGAPPPAPEIPPEPPPPTETTISPINTVPGAADTTESPAVPENERIAKRTQDSIKASESNQMRPAQLPNTRQPEPNNPTSNPTETATSPIDTVPGAADTGDATEAFPKESGLCRFVRQIVFVKPDIFIVADDIAADRPHDLELRFHPAHLSIPDAANVYVSRGAKALLRVNNFSFAGVEVTGGFTTARTMLPPARQRGLDKLEDPRGYYAIQVKTRRAAWRNAAALSWSPVGQEPARVSLEKRDEGHWIFHTTHGDLMVKWDGSEAGMAPGPK